MHSDNNVSRSILDELPVPLIEILTEDEGYTANSINGQIWWIVSSGNCFVVNTKKKSSQQDVLHMHVFNDTSASLITVESNSKDESVLEICAISPGPDRSKLLVRFWPKCKRRSDCESHADFVLSNLIYEKSDPIGIKRCKNQYVVCHENGHVGMFGITKGKGRQFRCEVGRVVGGQNLSREQTSLLGEFRNHLSAYFQSRSPTDSSQRNEIMLDAFADPGHIVCSSCSDISVFQEPYMTGEKPETMLLYKSKLNRIIRQCPEYADSKDPVRCLGIDIIGNTLNVFCLVGRSNSFSKVIMEWDTVSTSLRPISLSHLNLPLSIDVITASYRLSRYSRRLVVYNKSQCVVFTGSHYQHCDLLRNGVEGEIMSPVIFVDRASSIVMVQARQGIVTVDVDSIENIGGLETTISEAEFTNGEMDELSKKFLQAFILYNDHCEVECRLLIGEIETQTNIYQTVLRFALLLLNNWCPKLPGDSDANKRLSFLVDVMERRKRLFQDLIDFMSPLDKDEVAIFNDGSEHPLVQTLASLYQKIQIAVTLYKKSAEHCPQQIMNFLTDSNMTPAGDASSGIHVQEVTCIPSLLTIMFRHRPCLPLDWSEGLIEKLDTSRRSIAEMFSLDLRRHDWSLSRRLPLTGAIGKYIADILPEWLRENDTEDGRRRSTRIMRILVQFLDDQVVDDDNSQDEVMEGWASSTEEFNHWTTIRSVLIDAVYQQGMKSKALVLAHRFKNFDTVISLCEENEYHERIANVCQQYPDTALSQMIVDELIARGQAGALLEPHFLNVDSILRCIEKDTRINWIYFAQNNEHRKAFYALCQMYVSVTSLKKRRLILATCKLLAAIEPSIYIPWLDEQRLLIEMNLQVNPDIIGKIVEVNVKSDRRALSLEELVAAFICPKQSHQDRVTGYHRALRLVESSQTLANDQRIILEIQILCECLLLDQWNPGITKSEILVANSSTEFVTLIGYVQKIGGLDNKLHCHASDLYNSVQYADRLISHGLTEVMICSVVEALNE